MSTYRFVSFIIIILTGCFHFSVLASGTMIEGRILDHNKQPVPYATVTLNHTTTGTVTNEAGYFTMSNPGTESIELLIRCVGYEEKIHKVALSKLFDEGLVITLESASTSIDEVLVSGKTEYTLRKEQPFAINTIDAKPLQVQNLDVNQVLNTTTGVRIREEGGMGSGFNFSLNGFSGNQVKFFLDGIPMDNFGSSLTLNNIPVNLISSIEVYKGVVPVHLGSDALGGAVNVLTNNKVNNFLDFSYSIGSFNTHRAAVVSRYTHAKSGFTINVNGFYNYSDNNYKMFISVADSKKGGKYGEPEWITRFHDAYESGTIQLEAGMMNKRIADVLMVGLIASENYKELQTGHNMNIVIGEAFDRDKVLIPTLKYQKNDLFMDGLALNFFANFNNRQALSADTSSKSYDWYQQFTIKAVTSTSGEMAWYKTLFSYNDQSAQTIANLSYQLNDAHSFSLNNTSIFFSRVGEDPMSRAKRIPFENPNTLNKNITGLAYNLKLLGGKLRTVAFSKAFYMESLGYEGDRYSSTDSIFPKLETDTLLFGFGLASTYFLSNSTQIKLGFEKTYRLPEGYEMFGNGLGLLPNLSIKPEESKNFNIGMLSQQIYSNSRLMYELGFLYRLPENMIRYEAEGNDGRYKNLVSTKGFSIESGARYQYRNQFNVEVNATWQRMVHNNELTPVGGVNYLFGSQLANVPILFGNFITGYTFHNVLGRGNTLVLNWSSLYVEAFYLKSPVNGSPTGKHDIPRQLSHALNLSYSIHDGRYNLSLSCNNLSNSTLYDNWKLPKPGRAFNLKLRYYLSK